MQILRWSTYFIYRVYLQRLIRRATEDQLGTLTLTYCMNQHRVYTFCKIAICHDYNLLFHIVGSAPTLHT
jgi:hypothetical protein